MLMATRLHWLRITLVACGVLCLVLLPLTHLWPAGWSWYPRGSHSEHMIVIFYAVLGIFLIRAARDPMQNLSLIWFMVWSSIVHGGIMAVQSLVYPQHRGHLLGDVPVLLIAAVVLALLTPRGKIATASINQ